MRHRVVVTGIGLVAANGVGKEKFWAAIRAGISGLKPITTFDASAYGCQVGGEVHDSAFNTPSDLDKASKMIIAAGDEAMSDAGLLNMQSRDRNRMGVIVGTIHGGLLTFEKLHRSIVSDKNAQVTFNQLCECALYAPSWHLARRFDLKGPRSTVTMACASGTAAIGYAASLIRHGRADIVLAGGVDTMNEFIFSGFYALRALSLTKCRPFDRSRDGMVIGEGAAILILESLEHALAREATIYSEVIGYGLAADAAHITAPDIEGGGLARAISSAMEEANLNGEAIDYINAHGVGSVHSDAMECKAINKCFDPGLRRIPVSSTKPFTGHAMGAAGVLEAAVCQLAMRDGCLPVTLDCEQPDPSLDLDVITMSERQSKIDVAMSTSSGFGGQNAVVILSRVPRHGPKTISVAKRQRIAITGVGLVSPSTMGVKDFDSLSGERDSIRRALSDIAIARLIEGASSADTKRLRQMDNASRYAVLAARLAVEDARLDLSKTRHEQVGVVLGTAFGSLESDVQHDRKLICERERSLVSPLVFRNTSSNIPAAQVSIFLGFMGVNATIASGSVAGANAMAYSYDLLQERRAEIILTGAVEGSLAALENLPDASKCFDAQSLSEGAAILTLERLEAATRRRAKIYCEIAGYGMAHSNSSTSEALESAMLSALEDAQLRPEEVDCLSPNSIPLTLKEESTIRKVFGSRLKIEPSINVTRPFCVGGGAFNVVNCRGAIRPGQMRAISNTVGPDGNCVSIVFEVN